MKIQRKTAELLTSNITALVNFLQKQRIQLHFVHALETEIAKPILRFLLCNTLRLLWGSIALAVLRNIACANAAAIRHAHDLLRIASPGYV
jgi:hypothetical protein